MGVGVRVVKGSSGAGGGFGEGTSLVRGAVRREKASVKESLWMARVNCSSLVQDSPLPLPHTRAEEEEVEEMEAKRPAARNAKEEESRVVVVVGCGATSSSSSSPPSPTGVSDTP